MSTILHILQHALGRDEYGIQRKNSGVDYRNHYCASEGGESIKLCREAVVQDLMVERKGSDITGGDSVFIVTDKGKEYVKTNSKPEPKLTAGQIRYRKWLDITDATGEKFGAWLKRMSRERRVSRA
jgi:hypothetical protein